MKIAKEFKMPQITISNIQKRNKNSENIEKKVEDYVQLDPNRRSKASGATTKISAQNVKISKK